jgi:hypothetical protein
MSGAFSGSTQWTRIQRNRTRNRNSVAVTNDRVRLAAWCLLVSVITAVCLRSLIGSSETRTKGARRSSSRELTRFGSGPDIPNTGTDVRFSNRPVGVEHFQAIRHCSVDVSRGLALLFGIGQGPSIMGSEDKVEQSLPRPCRQSNGRAMRTYELTSFIVPRGTAFHRKVFGSWYRLVW